MENQTDPKVYPTTPDEKGYYFTSEANETAGIKSRVYPSPADAEGWFTENADDEVLEIETKVYENNGAKVKRGTLSDGRKFQTRELKGRDSIQANKQGKNDEGLIQAALVSIATKVDDKTYVMEDYLDNFKLKDYARMLNVCQSLNF